MANYLMGRYGVGSRRACRCVRLVRSMYYYRSIMDPLTSLRQRVRELAHARVPVRLSAPLRAAEARGLGCWGDPVLSGLLRGKPGIAAKAALATRDSGA